MSSSGVEMLVLVAHILENDLEVQSAILSFLYTHVRLFAGNVTYCKHIQDYTGSSVFDNCSTTCTKYVFPITSKLHGRELILRKGKINTNENEVCVVDLKPVGEIFYDSVALPIVTFGDVQEQVTLPTTTPTGEQFLTINSIIKERERRHEIAFNEEFLTLRRAHRDDAVLVGVLFAIGACVLLFCGLDHM